MLPKCMINLSDKIRNGNNIRFDLMTPEEVEKFNKDYIEEVGKPYSPRTLYPHYSKRAVLKAMMEEEVNILHQRKDS